ncbi:phosphoglycerate mutase-like protein [Sodiomyces alkalinus F11]|uniref:Phosphoglycerate mutase-like protein n=1 Tax=Sodiomyces alkalinus (strain CBS 110278 / VKM F-3762 / F11) TaxID=1314773 RepID=A0A3N2PKS2_SODAK|nr:phosphoglycerate mutase-like protein [Sodiomyces alkalinus F11]ROT35123.1 phosphoglycerate mutase-like protein [Sodiomyces alkalinus F11]
MGSLNIFLVRHGESVDNVAGIYAGIRDSPLTAHGVLQTRRLASHLATLTPRPAWRVTHIFTSTLQRAIRTAEAIRDAQSERSTSEPPVPDIEIRQLPDLRERDFGSDEGKKFGRLARASDAETHASLRERAERFLNEHLAPILSAAASATSCATASSEGTSAGGGKEGEEHEPQAVFVVAHGLILASFLRVLLSPGLFVLPAGTAVPVDVSPAWSNTGYTQLVLSSVASSEGDADMPPDGPESSSRCRTRPRWSRLRLDVACVNNTHHLAGLKKTRGGIGSARFDDKQKTLTSFFGPASSSSSSRKRKAVDELEKWYVHPWSTHDGSCSFFFPLPFEAMARHDERPKFTDLY